MVDLVSTPAKEVLSKYRALYARYLGGDIESFVTAGRFQAANDPSILPTSDEQLREYAFIRCANKIYTEFVLAALADIKGTGIYVIGREGYLPEGADINDIRISEINSAVVFIPGAGYFVMDLMGTSRLLATTISGESIDLTGKIWPLDDIKSMRLGEFGEIPRDIFPVHRESSSSNLDRARVMSSLYKNIDDRRRMEDFVSLSNFMPDNRMRLHNHFEINLFNIKLFVLSEIYRSEMAIASPAPVMSTSSSSQPDRLTPETAVKLIQDLFIIIRISALSDRLTPSVREEINRFFESDLMQQLLMNHSSAIQWVELARVLVEINTTSSNRSLLSLLNNPLIIEQVYRSRELLEKDAKQVKNVVAEIMLLGLVEYKAEAKNTLAAPNLGSLPASSPNQWIVSDTLLQILYTAARQPNPGETISILLEMGVNPNQQNARGWWPLFIATRFTKVSALRALLAYPDINVNLQTVNSGMTPLIAAIDLACKSLFADEEGLEILELLIERSDLTVRNKDNQTAEEFFIMRRNEMTGKANWSDTQLDNLIQRLKPNQENQAASSMAPISSSSPEPSSSTAPAPVEPPTDVEVTAAEQLLELIDEAGGQTLIDEEYKQIIKETMADKDYKFPEHIPPQMVLALRIIRMYSHGLNAATERGDKEIRVENPAYNPTLFKQTVWRLMYANSSKLEDYFRYKSPDSTLPANQHLFEALNAIPFEMDKMTEALAQGADINHRNSQGWTPLMLAVHTNNTDAVKRLLRESANPDYQTTRSKATALMMAVIQANKTGQLNNDIVHSLLSYQANTTMHSIQGKTARTMLQEWATQHPENKVADFLTQLEKMEKTQEKFGDLRVEEQVQPTAVTWQFDGRSLDPTALIRAVQPAPVVPEASSSMQGYAATTMEGSSPDRVWVTLPIAIKAFPGIAYDAREVLNNLELIKKSAMTEFYRLFWWSPDLPVRFISDSTMFIPGQILEHGMIDESDICVELLLSVDASNLNLGQHEGVFTAEQKKEIAKNMSSLVGITMIAARQNGKIISLTDTAASSVQTPLHFADAPTVQAPKPPKPVVANTLPKTELTEDEFYQNPLSKFITWDEFNNRFKANIRFLDVGIMELSRSDAASYQSHSYGLKRVVCSLYYGHLKNMTPRESIDLLLGIVKRTNISFYFGDVFNALLFLGDPDLINEFKNRLTPETGVQLIVNLYNDLSLQAHELSPGLGDEMDGLLESEFMQSTLATINPDINYIDLACALIKLNTRRSNKTILQLLLTLADNPMAMGLVYHNINQLTERAKQHDNEVVLSVLTALSNQMAPSSSTSPAPTSQSMRALIENQLLLIDASLDAAEPVVPNVLNKELVVGGTIEEFGAVLASVDPALINQADETGETPFLMAVAAGDYDKVVLMYRLGANPLIANSAGLSAFDIAIFNNFTQILEFLNHPEGNVEVTPQVVLPQQPVASSSSQPPVPRAYYVSKMIAPIRPAYSPFRVPEREKKNFMVKFFEKFGKMSDMTTVINPLSAELEDITRGVRPAMISITTPTLNLAGRINNTGSNAHARMETLDQLITAIETMANEQGDDLPESSARYLLAVTAILLGEQVNSNNYLTKLGEYRVSLLEQAAQVSGPVIRGYDQ